MKKLVFKDLIESKTLHNYTKRFISGLLSASLIVCGFLSPALLYPAQEAHAAVIVQPPNPLVGLAVNPGNIQLDNIRGQSSIMLNHDKPPDLVQNLVPTPPGGSAHYTGRTVKYYLDEYNKGYRGKPAIRTVEDRRNGDEWTGSAFKIDGLPSGTIYDIDASVYTQYDEIEVNGAIRRGNSLESQLTGSPVRIYTGTQLSANLISADQIRLNWDDVWFDGVRVYAYDLKIYTSSTAANPERTIRFTDSQIGPGLPLTVDQSTGKLEYIYTVPYPGRVYCFEIVPVMTNVPNVIVPAKNAKVTASTTILVTATKLYEGDNTVTWELKWSNVTAGMGAATNSRYTAEYSLSKLGGKVSYTLLQKIDNANSTILETPKDPNHPDNLNALYEITAKIFEDGREMYVEDNIIITSGPFSLKEGEIPYRPQAPVLKLMPDQPLETEAEIWWNIPRQVTEPDLEDANVDYEIYVLDDPQQLNLLNQLPNYVASGQALLKDTYDGELGYRYLIPNLKPNTTYYLAVRATKGFLDFIDLSYLRLSSELSYVIVTTKPLLPTGRPPAPTTLDIYKEEIKSDSARFFSQSLWYESFENDIGEWVVCDKRYQPDGSDTLENDTYRKLQYEKGDQINLYYTRYVEGMDLDDPDSFSGFGMTSVAITIFDEKYPTNILVTDLEPNTTYVFWAKAQRNTELSFPSKTIVVTTPPLPNTDLETPTVPDFDFVFIGDTYIDITWIKKPDYRYNIQVSRVDNFNSGGVITISTSTQEISSSGTDFYRVTGLMPDTLYYFRIQAEATSLLTGEVKQSAWSDSKPARTKPPMPPATPAGFGVKPTKNAVTKNSIFYEWLMTPGLEYIFEYGQDSKMADSTEINLGHVTEYNLLELLSNHRYYARLYAYDPITRLRSAPTYIVGVRTLRSDDDYDSDVDTTLPLTGEFVVKDTYAVNGVWTVKVVGWNADRLVERIMTDTMLDYLIDLSEPPKYTEKISLIMEGLVFESLDKMLENLELKLKDKSFVFRPKTLAAKLAGTKAGRLIRNQYEILFELGGNDDYYKPQGYNLKTEVTGLFVHVLDGSDRLPADRFQKGVRVVVPFTSATWYQESVTRGIVLDESGKWQAVKTTAAFNPDTRKGTVVFEYPASGNYALADIAQRGLFNDISGGYSTYINKLGAKGVTDVPIGGYFRPNDAVTPAEAVELLFLAMGYPYTDDYMDSAVKAGFVSGKEQQEMKMEEVLAMLVRAYEVKTGIKIKGNPSDDGSGSGWTNGVQDLKEPIRSRVQFALDNGLAAPVLRSELDNFPAGRVVTRGELAAFTYMLLEMMGNL